MNIKCHYTSEFQIYLLVRPTNCSQPFGLSGSKDCFSSVQRNSYFCVSICKESHHFYFRTLLWAKHFIEFSFSTWILYIIHDQWKLLLVTSKLYKKLKLQAVILLEMLCILMCDSLCMLWISLFNKETGMAE